MLRVSPCLLLASVVLFGCKGDIVIGVDMLYSLDAQVRRDTGNNNGPPDSGPPPDAGCNMRTRPPLTMQWPYPATKSAYQASFWSVLPMRSAALNGCSSANCHGAIPPAIRPSIPDLEGALDDPTILATAINDLWSRVLPTTVAGSPDPQSPLAWRHSALGGIAPTFLPEQEMFIAQFIERSHDCYWLPEFEEADGGVSCQPGTVCDCPLPVLDLTYCTQ